MKKVTEELVIANKLFWKCHFSFVFSPISLKQDLLCWNFKWFHFYAVISMGIIPCYYIKTVKLDVKFKLMVEGRYNQYFVHILVIYFIVINNVLFRSILIHKGPSWIHLWSIQFQKNNNDSAVIYTPKANIIKRKSIPHLWHRESACCILLSKTQFSSLNSCRSNNSRTW